MKAKTYGIRISEALVELLKSKRFKTKALYTNSPFVSKIEVYSNNGYRLNVKSELTKNLDSIQIKITEPSYRRTVYNVIYQMDEPFANHKMLEEATNKIYNTLIIFI